MKWVKIHNHYAVSESGHVKNLKTGKILTPRVKHKRGDHVEYGLSVNGKVIYKEIQLIMREAGLISGNGDVVHHKDGNTLNNSKSNLESISKSENAKKENWNKKQ